MTKLKRIGVLTSGGDCGGLNAVIRAIFFEFLAEIIFNSYLNFLIDNFQVFF